MKSAIAVCMLVGCAASDPVSIDEEDLQGPVLDGFFPIAADFQPHSSFDKWQGRGINTVIRVPGDDSIGDWTDSANHHGLKMIRAPKNDPHDDAHEPNLIAWQWEDEPELKGKTASDLESFRQHMANIDPQRPIFVNFWGGGMREANADGCFNGHCYPDYIHHADWISDDIYPCNKFDCRVDVVGQEVSQLRQWGDGQPAFAYIETGDFDGNGTRPSPHQYAAEVWDAVIHGARGVFYFSERIRVPCAQHCLESYDDTPNDVVDEMKKVNDRLTRLAPVLQRAINPHSADFRGPDDLRLGWRHDVANHQFVFLALNRTGDAKSNVHLQLRGVNTNHRADVAFEGRTLPIGGDGTISDDFGPYELHVYRVDAK